jgi:hypothetical protein
VERAASAEQPVRLHSGQLEAGVTEVRFGGLHSSCYKTTDGVQSAGSWQMVTPIALAMRMCIKIKQTKFTVKMGGGA